MGALDLFADPPDRLIQSESGFHTDHHEVQRIRNRPLERILAARWLHPGSIVLADNMLIPGAPAFRAFMRAAERTTWRTIEHPAHVEYQSLLKDLVLESEYLG